MAERTEKHEAEIDRLYGLPLEEFTAARDALARELRRDGARQAGDEIKRLRKPSVAAWALNQVRRNDRGQTDELLKAGERLGEEQERLLEGGSREAFDRAATDERRLVGGLARHAERELVAAGRSVSAAVQERLRATLHAVATDPEAREALATGRLVRDHEAAGLGPIAAGPAPASGTRARKQTREPSARAAAALERRARALEERLERARARQVELDEEGADAVRGLREARREAARVASELERAAAAEEQARERAKEAAEAVSELERELRELTARRPG